MPPTVTIADVPVLAKKDAIWSLTTGPVASSHFFEIDRGNLTKIGAAGQDFVTLSMRVPGFDPLIVKKLRIVATAPGHLPETVNIQVVDRRWLWMRKIIPRTYNKRRRTGETRLVGEGRIETQPIADDIAYAPWSLKPNGEPWTPKEVLEDILGHLVGGDFTIDEGALENAIEIEDLDTTGYTGAQAIGAALSYVSGAAVTVDPDGTARVFSTRSEGESFEIREAGRPLFGRGQIAIGDRRFDRPRRIRVYFESEVEIRFDYTEGDDGAGSVTETTTREGGSDNREPRQLQNVMPNPDIELNIGGGVDLAQGTIRPIADYYAAWPGSANPTPPGQPDLDDAVMRRHWLGLWSLMSSKYGVDQNAAPDRIWLNRVAALRGSWRQVFRILRQWHDRIKSIRAYRVGIVDNETGTRAPSKAYMDYVIKASMHGLAKEESEYHKLGWQVNGYNEDLSEAVASPALVSVLDEDLGLLRVDLRPDPGGEAAELAPGRLENEEDFPSHNASEAFASWHAVGLSSNFSIAIIVSCIKGSPNSKGRYHEEVVSPRDVGVREPCLGPEMDLFVGGGFLTARFAWDDARSDEIEDAFFGDDGGDTTSREPGGEEGAEEPPKMPIDLLNNLDHVRHVARAMAQREWEARRDRLLGASSYGWDPRRRIRGSITAVRFEVAKGKESIGTTSIVINPQLAPLDMAALLPHSVRSVIFRLVQP